MILRDAIVAHARRYTGVRFAHQGRGWHGLDCLGLLLVTAQDAGLQFENGDAMAIDVPTYSWRPDISLLKQQLDRFLVPIHEKLLPADILLLKVNGSPQHLAIVTDYPMRDELGMIHAYAPTRAVIEHRYDTTWQHDTFATYRLPQLV